MTKEIHPVDPQLVENLRNAENLVENAKAVLTEAQYHLYLACKDRLPPKGTTHFEGVKIATAQNEKWDQNKLTEIEPTWPRKSNMPWPFKKTWKPDSRAISYLRENAKESYEALSDALTIEDKKPTFELTEI